MDSFDDLINDMLPLLDRLDSGTYRPKYNRSGRVAWGWAKRVSRGVEAVMTLQRSGFAGEVSPLMRSVVEHSVALRWLAAEGNGILGPLATNHGYGVTRLLEAWKGTGDEVDEAHFVSVIESVQHDDHGRDELQHFKNRVDRYGSLHDLYEYYGQMLTSHATYQSAVGYWSHVEMEPSDMGGALPTVVVEPDYRRSCAAYLYISHVAYNSIFLAHPWTATLTGIRARLVAIQPGLDTSLPEVGA